MALAPLRAPPGGASRTPTTQITKRGRAGGLTKPQPQGPRWVPMAKARQKLCQTPFISVENGCGFRPPESPEVELKAF